MVAFRLPSRRVIQGSRQVTPASYGRATKYMSVQAQLNHYVAAGNAQLIEAISVDGFEINYWRRGTEGKYCTCHDPKRADEPHVDPAGGPLESRNDNIEADDLTNTEFGSTKFTVRGAYDRLERLDNTRRTVFGDVDLGKPPLSENVLVPKSYDDETHDDAQLEQDANNDAFLRMGENASILFGGERTPCGICFGTGYVGGYSLFAGKREVFDASGTYKVTDQSMFWLDRSKKPYAFTGPADPNAYVEFTYELPTYPIAALNLIVRNNQIAAPNLSILYKIESSEDAFAPLTLDWLNSRNGIPTIILIRVVPTLNTLDTRTQFTHVELTWQLAPWPKFQMSALNEQTNFTIYDSLLTTTFIIPPTLPHVGKEDVVYEHKYEKLWKLNDTTDNMTSSKQVMGWSADARVVQDYEQLSLLKLTVNTNYELTYSGLELTQGAGVAGPGQF